MNRPIATKAKPNKSDPVTNWLNNMASRIIANTGTIIVTSIKLDDPATSSILKYNG